MSYLTVIMYVLLAIAVIATLNVVYGTVAEDRGLTLEEKLLERAKEWNRLAAINETLAMEARFYNFTDADYCAKEETGYIEYCIIGLKSIECDYEQQIKCRKYVEMLEKRNE